MLQGSILLNSEACLGGHAHREPGSTGVGETKVQVSSTPRNPRMASTMVCETHEAEQSVSKVAETRTSFCFGLPERLFCLRCPSAKYVFFVAVVQSHHCNKAILRLDQSECA